MDHFLPGKRLFLASRNPIRTPMIPCTGLEKLSLIFLLAFGCLAEPFQAWSQPGIAWDKTLGGADYEELNALQITGDGIIVGGSSRSNATLGDPADFSWNFLVYKLDFNRNVVWQNMYGGDSDERLWMLILCSDGGMLCGGYSYSGVSGDKTEPSRGDMDVWIVRLDDAGNILWDKTLGGPGRDELFSALEMPGGGFLLGCHSYSGIGGDKTEASRGDQDFWLLRIDDSGNLLWDKTLGGDSQEQIHDLEWAPDGNVLISGGTLSTANSGETGPDSARGGKDFWIGEINPGNGQLIWSHRFGGTGEDFAYALCVSRSGKIYLGGRSGSLPAPPTMYNNGKDSPFYGGDSDYWLLELDGNGIKLREWSFGGAGLDDLYMVHENKRGDLILCGVTDSGISGNKTAASHGGYDFWALDLDPASGFVRWQGSLGGSGNEAPTKVAQFADGALLFGGHSGSNISFEKTEDCLGGNDFWIVATNCEPSVLIEEAAGYIPCSGQTLTLAAQAEACDSCLFLWNNEAVSPAIELPPGTSGTFSVMALDIQGCMVSDSIFASVGMAPIIDLGPSDTLVLAGTVLSIGGGTGPGWQYLWSDGSTGSTLLADAAGFYSVTVTDASGCTASDAISLRFIQKNAVWVPNVFSPNLDGVNDYFGIYTDNSVREVITFQVYDRWGELCFRRDHFVPFEERDGWDGVYRGKRMKPGVLVWLAEVEYLNGEKGRFKGNVTLLR